MAGKAYTMKEMKFIVDYLTEHKAYNEVKGRKMWMDFEKSNLTDRTWQSLKETFLKRILPDIHNPYYQLSVTQISSFRQGYDIETKLKNKLEITTLGEESSTNVEQVLNTEHPSTSNDNASGRKSGEDTINTETVSHHRSSAETVVLDNCYDNVEQIQNELEGNKNNDKEDNSDPSSQKSLRDLITYSEPLTPMLQEVIEDFATDEESDSVTKMEIVEDVNVEKQSKDGNSQTFDGPFEISSDADDICKEKNRPELNNENQHNDNEVANENREQLETANLTQQVTEISVQEITSTEVPANDKSSTELISEQVNIVNKDKNMKEITTFINTDENIESNSLQNQAETTNNSEKSGMTQNTTDTLIPNNQEALNTQDDIVSQINDKGIEAKVPEKSKELNKRKRTRHEVKFTDQDSRSWSVNDKNADSEIQEVSSELFQSQVCKPKKFRVSDSENKGDSIPDRNTNQLEKLTEANEERVSVEIRSDTENITKTQADPTRNVSSEIENPCLKSVSLYDEQFTTTKYSESSDAGIADTKRNDQEKNNTDINKNSSDNDIVLVKSHSESSSQQINKRKTPAVRSAPTKSERKKLLANMFGFSGGTTTNSRKRRVSYRNRSAPRHSRARMSSESSEWTSESDNEFVSPPRGRRDRHSGRYLKPKSARIFSLEEEGGIFVMYGKKIYPVVKDGKLVKNYVTYAPERESSGEDESYWKLKYMEEKKRTAKLTKLLHQSEDNDRSSEKGPEVDLTRDSSPKEPNVSKAQTVTKSESSAMSENVPNKTTPEVQKELEIPKEPVPNKTVKIKITKQNEEVELEGHWSQINPVLDHVVQILHKDVEPKPNLKSLTPSEQTKISLSGLSTPIIPIVDQEVQEKVWKMETEIFQEIESRDKQVEHCATPQSLSTDSSKVTKRRKQTKRSKVSSVSDTPTPDADKNGLSSPSKQIEKEQNAEKSAPAEVENGTSPPAVVRRITRTSKNALRESTDTNESKARKTRNKKAKEPPAKEIMDEEADVRYKLRSPPTSAKKATRSAANKTTKEQKPKNRYFKITEEVVSSRDNMILNPIESSQGYQDSDVSPPKLLRKRKVRRNVTTALLSGKAKPRSRQNIRRRSQLKYYEMSDQSSNSCPNFALISKTIRKEGSSSNSDIYRSESLQLLMPKTTIGMKSKCDVYDAFSQQVNRIITNAGHNNFEAPMVDKDLLTLENISNGNNSSNVSLPPSPILSIVENLSIDKNSLNISYDENVIAHEYQMEECNNNDFVITNEDVTMLLMRQSGDNQATALHDAEQNHNENSSNAMVTDSFLHKLFTVNLNQDNPTVSDSLHQKIRNLLLESAKKMPPNSQDILKNEVSNKMNAETDEFCHKNRLSKRCSTPLKRQVNKKVKRKTTGMKTFIEEEHTDSCSQSARRSCPPITYNPGNVEYINTETANPAEKTRNSKGRKKKDIIKVKILRPKAKSYSREILTEQTRNNRESNSIHGDSGINDTEPSMLPAELDRSVELIHNHSETCLQTDECINNSVEYVESNRSVVSVVTDSELSNNTEHNSQLVNDSVQNIQCELLVGDSGTASISRNVIGTSSTDANISGTYHTPLSRETPDSLITEDLSEPEQEYISNKSSKWYLLSEDETTNTNFPQTRDYGSDLNKLFPIACAVPNLSTITEMSKDNDNKPVETDGDTRNDLLSQSLFDSNF